MAANYHSIFRNVGFLYVRMLVSMLVTLYTARVIVGVLGVDDFGVYLAMVSLVTLLGLALGGMSNAAQRFFSLDIGKTGGQRQTPILNASLQLFLGMGVLITVLCLTLGHWLIDRWLQVPSDRVGVVHLAFYWVVGTFLLSFWVMPFRGLLLAHERMDIFAMVGLAEVFLRLLGAIALQYLPGDKLMVYAVSLSVLGSLGLALTATAALRQIPSARLRLQTFPAETREILRFVRWDILFNFSPAVRTEGSVLLVNLFFGPAVNGALGLAEQANRAVKQFIIYMQAAFNPQITRLYGQAEGAEAASLATAASRYNFMLFFAMALPLWVNAEVLLGWWLVDVPDQTALFLRFALLASLVECLSFPIMTLGLATDRVRLLQTLSGGALLANLPVSAWLLSRGMGPEVVLQVAAGLAAAGLLARMLVVSRTTAFSIRTYLSAVAGPLIAVGVIGFGSVSLLSGLFAEGNELIRLVCQTLITLMVVAALGFSASERTSVVRTLSARLIRRQNKSTVTPLGEAGE